MQNNSAKRDGQPEDAARQAADREINERLAEHLRDNAIKANPSARADDRAPQQGFFAEASAILGLVGLMIVAYVYTLVVGNEA